MRAYLAARATLNVAERACEQALRTAYPLGSDIAWMHGEHPQRGEVVMHGYGLRPKALNKHTGREVWLDASRISLP